MKGDRTWGMTNDDDDRFCPECGVVLDLHDGPDTCPTAEKKADLLNQFGWMVR